MAAEDIIIRMGMDATAFNQAIGNWDTYGVLAHNFFLYGEPGSGRIHFIPWDFDLSFDGTGPSDLTLRTFDGSWPLLQAVARDADLATRTDAVVDAGELDGVLAQRSARNEARARDALRVERALQAQRRGGGGGTGAAGGRACVGPLARGRQ